MNIEELKSILNFANVNKSSYSINDNWAGNIHVLQVFNYKGCKYCEAFYSDEKGNINDYKSLVKKEIVQKLKEIRNELLSRYNLCKMKKEVKIEDIIDVIFNNKDEKIFEGKIELVRIFIQDTDDLIEENLNIDINDKLFVGVKHIHSLFELDHHLVLINHKLYYFLLNLLLMVHLKHLDRYIHHHYH